MSISLRDTNSDGNSSSSTLTIEVLDKVPTAVMMSTRNRRRTLNVALLNGVLLMM